MLEDSLKWGKCLLTQKVQFWGDLGVTFLRSYGPILWNLQFFFRFFDYINITVLPVIGNLCDLVHFLKAKLSRQIILTFWSIISSFKNTYFNLLEHKGLTLLFKNILRYNTASLISFSSEICLYLPLFIYNYTPKRHGLRIECWLWPWPWPWHSKI